MLLSILFSSAITLVDGVSLKSLRLRPLNKLIRTVPGSNLLSKNSIPESSNVIIKNLNLGTQSNFNRGQLSVFNSGPGTNIYQRRYFSSNKEKDPQILVIAPTANEILDGLQIPETESCENSLSQKDLKNKLVSDNIKVTSNLNSVTDSESTLRQQLSDSSYANSNKFNETEPSENLIYVKKLNQKFPKFTNTNTSNSILNQLKSRQSSIYLYFTSLINELSNEIKDKELENVFKLMGFESDISSNSIASCDGVGYVGNRQEIRDAKIQLTMCREVLPKVIKSLEIDRNYLCGEVLGKRIEKLLSDENLSNSGDNLNHGNPIRTKSNESDFKDLDQYLENHIKSSEQFSRSMVERQARDLESKNRARIIREDSQKKTGNSDQ